MPAGIEIYNYVTNQKGSPAIWSDVLAARPPAGFIGRLFVSTDTFEIYRDNGITWDLIGGGGGPAVNIYNSNGTLTGTRVVTMAGNNLTFEGGASTARIAMSANNNVPRIFSFRTAGVPRWAFRIDGNETGSNIGGDFALRAYNDAGAFTFSPLSVERRTGEKSLIANETLTTSAANLTGVYNLTTATMGAGVSLTGGNPQAASHNNYTVINDGSYTVADSIFFGAQSNVLRLTSSANGTATFTQTGNIRSAAANLNQVQYDTSNGSAITYTHVAVGQNLGIYRLSGAGSLAITNAYGQLINDLNEYGNTNLTITNRWGIFQNSVTDVNYLGGTTLIGTTTNSGYKLDISGTIRNTSAAIFATTFGQNVGIGTLITPQKLTVDGNVTISGRYQVNTGNSAGITDISYGSFLNGAWVNTPPATSGFLACNGLQAMRWTTNTITHSINTVQVLTLNATGFGVFTVAPIYTLDVGGSFRNTTGAALATISGNVLIGTLSDTGAKLQINDSMRLTPTTTIPTANAGTLYYDSSTNKLKLHDGTSFVDLN